MKNKKQKEDVNKIKYSLDANKYILEKYPNLKDKIEEENKILNERLKNAEK